MLWTRNDVAVRREDVPVVSPDGFREACVEGCTSGARIAALCALPRAHSEGGQEILVVLADDSKGSLGLLRARLAEDLRYPALSAELPQAQAFERELFEEHGIHPQGHPWLKPLRKHLDLEEPNGSPYPFFQVEGPGVHEVAVGPVHAGIIEPGHFRFQCHGETVLHLEIQLGYQHRGAEALLLRSAPARRLVVAESVAGDTAIGHAFAYCMTLETLAKVEAPLSAQAVRAISLELERISNHVGDLGGLCNDIGYLPGASWFGRLRGEFLNLLLEISGNRYGRGLLRLGGVRFGISAGERKGFLARLARAERDLKDTAELTFNAPSVGSRFEETGVVTHEAAEELGLVGPAARASGCDRDARRDHPFGVFRFAHIPVALVESGDVMARALVRWLEIQRSITFLKEQIAELPDAKGLSSASMPALQPNSLAVSLVEGWRGEIAHVAVTGAGGRLAGYKIVDPSFHNWLGMAMAVRGNRISDFPLCNKSFNLSYAGHDL